MLGSVMILALHGAHGKGNQRLELPISQTWIEASQRNFVCVSKAISLKLLERHLDF